MRTVDVVQFELTEGVYLLRDENGVVVYVGESQNVYSRLKDHQSEKAGQWCTATIVKTDGRPLLYRRILEAKLVCRLAPRLNKSHGRYAALRFRRLSSAKYLAPVASVPVSVNPDRAGLLASRSALMHRLNSLAFYSDFYAVALGFHIDVMNVKGTHIKECLPGGISAAVSMSRERRALIGGPASMPNVSSLLLNLEYWSIRLSSGGHDRLRELGCYNRGPWLTTPDLVQADADSGRLRRLRGMDRDAWSRTVA